MEEDQLQVCLRYGATFSPASPLLKLGMAESAFRGEQPLNGLRHPPEIGTSGWFIWGGEHFPDNDGFHPIHTSHMLERCPAVVPYLALPPGWRFLIAPNYEDVWFDASLLDINVN